MSNNNGDPVTSNTVLASIKSLLTFSGRQYSGTTDPRFVSPPAYIPAFEMQYLRREGVVTDASGQTSSPAAPSNTSIPTISGTPQVGQTLTGNVGSFSGAPTSYAYQWKRAGSSTVLATTLTYSPATGDIGNGLTFTVIATNATGSSSPAISAATAAVTAASSSGANARSPIFAFGLLDAAA